MKSILAIDDNEINLDLLFHILKIHFPDYNLLKALGGDEGIEIAKKAKPEIILLDILMPGLSGYEVCEILKNDDLTQHIPILMISALGQDSTERIKGLDAGADAFISKPVNQGELKAQINVALRIKKVEDLLRKRNESLEIFTKYQTRKFAQKEERVFQISEHAMEFYWEVDYKGIFIYVSPVVEKILNIKPLQIIGEKNILELFQLTEKNLKKNKFKINFFKETSFNDFEVKLDLKKRVVWLSISGFPMLNENGEYRGARGVCHDITRRKKAEIALNEKILQINNYQKNLKKLNSEITLVEERERKRIAENLHDVLGQTLSLAFMNLSSVNIEHCTPDVKDKINETSTLLARGINESRRLTYDLSPPILHELGLVPAIKWKLEEIEANHNIRTRIKEIDILNNIQKEIGIFIYRIVCELITNIIKHAKANKIEVEVTKKDRLNTIIVKDNGIGFKSDLNINATNKGGFGLISIIERLDGINGYLEIDSKIGEGTKAAVHFPVNKE